MIKERSGSTVYPVMPIRIPRDSMKCVPWFPLTTQVPVLGMEQVLSRTLDYSVDEEDGLLCVRLVDAPDDKTEVLLRTMVLGLKGIQKAYSDYLAIEEHRR